VILGRLGRTSTTEEEIDVVVGVEVWVEIAGGSNGVGKVRSLGWSVSTSVIAMMRDRCRPTPARSVETRTYVDQSRVEKVVAAGVVRKVDAGHAIVAERADAIHATVVA